MRLEEYMSRTGTQNEQRQTREEERAVVAAMGGEIRAGGYYRFTCGYIYAVGECGGPMRKAPCPNVGTTLVDSSIAWRLAINMWHWMVQERLLGLSKHVVPCILMCGSSSSSFGTVGFLLEQVYLKRCLILAAFAKCVMISADDEHLAWLQV